MNTSRRKELFIGAGFVVLVVALMIFAGAASSGKSSTQTTFTGGQTTPITASDHVKGNPSASVSVIEYGDFQCPACAQYEPIIQQLISEYGDRVTFAFRHFPLYQAHPNAEIASQAAEAAASQGKFWEMHDFLYAKQSEWSGASTRSVVSDHFSVYASSLGLDVAKFEADIRSEAVINKVNADAASGNAARVNHTPTFFINLVEIKNPANYDEFKSVIDAALAASSTQAQ